MMFIAESNPEVGKTKLFKFTVKQQVSKDDMKHIDPTINLGTLYSQTV